MEGYHNRNGMIGVPITPNYKKRIVNIRPEEYTPKIRLPRQQRRLELSGLGILILSLLGLNKSRRGV